MFLYSSDRKSLLTVTQLWKWRVIDRWVAWCYWLLLFIYFDWFDMKKYKEIDVLLVFWHLIYKMVKKPFFISAHYVRPSSGPCTRSAVVLCVLCHCVRDWVYSGMEGLCMLMLLSCIYVYFCPHVALFVLRLMLAHPWPDGEVLCSVAPSLFSTSGWC